MEECPCVRPFSTGYPIETRHIIWFAENTTNAVRKSKRVSQRWILCLTFRRRPLGICSFGAERGDRMHATSDARHKRYEVGALFTIRHVRVRISAAAAIIQTQQFSSHMDTYVCGGGREGGKNQSNSSHICFNVTLALRSASLHSAQASC